MTFPPPPPYVEGHDLLAAKTVLVTAAAGSGIGFAVAKRCQEEGARLVIADKHERRLAESAAELGVLGVPCDVTQEADVQNLFAAAAEELGGIDVLINNAGLLLDEDKDALSVTPEIFENTIRTNTLGPWLVSQAFVPLLKKSAAPRIVNVSSGGGQLEDGADGWAPAYCVSKTALNGVTVQLAAALPKCAVNSVCPGWVRTDMGGENATRSIAEGAATIVWLATDAPHDLTGKFIKDRKVIPW